MKTLHSLTAGLVAWLLLATAPAFAQFKVIGYVPSWTGDVNAVQYDKLTHINYSFLLPNGDGSLKPIENPAKLQSLVAAAHTRGVKVLVSVGGWLDGDPSVFVSIANNATYTTTFNNNLLNFISQYGLDGIDIDWEHPTAATANSYASLMQSLGTQLHSRGKLLSTAVAGGTWAGPYILTSVFNSLDFMNVMAYDDAGAAHSTYELAAQSLDYWRGRGLPASKLVLGVPFYAQPSGTTYAVLLTQGADPNADFFNGQGYNGISTIKRKTNLAFDKGSGIMIWQLAGDATGSNSLLTAIDQVVKSRNQPPPATGVATFFADCAYSGGAVALPVGSYSLAALQARGLRNDDVSSVRVSAGYEVVLYENDLSGGAALTLSADNTCLTGNALGTANWNDKTTSILVRAASTSTFSRQLEAEAANVNNGFVAESCNEGGQNMGYTDAGDYLVWNAVNFPTTGTYLLEYRVASGASGGTISADLNAGAIQLGSTAIPATGGWQTWTTVAKTITVNAGTYNFGIYAQSAGYNLNWVRISKATNARQSQALTALDTQNDQQLSLYPNPASSQLQLAVAPTLAGSTYRVVNSAGQTVRAGTLGTTLEVATLPAGLYILVVKTSAAQTLSRRFTKE
jgi:chitinase